MYYANTVEPFDCNKSSFICLDLLNILADSFFNTNAQPTAGSVVFIDGPEKFIFRVGSKSLSKMFIIKECVYLFY